MGFHSSLVSTEMKLTGGGMERSSLPLPIQSIACLKFSAFTCSPTLALQGICQGGERVSSFVTYMPSIYSEGMISPGLANQSAMGEGRGSSVLPCCCLFSALCQFGHLQSAWCTFPKLDSKLDLGRAYRPLLWRHYLVATTHSHR